MQSPADVDSGRIAGHVVTAYAELVREATVTLARVNDQEVRFQSRTTRTDEDGSFSFTQLPEGRYRGPGGQARVHQQADPGRCIRTLRHVRGGAGRRPRERRAGAGSSRSCSAGLRASRVASFDRMAALRRTYKCRPQSVGAAGGRLSSGRKPRVNGTVDMRSPGCHRESTWSAPRTSQGRPWE